MTKVSKSPITSHCLYIVQPHTLQLTLSQGWVITQQEWRNVPETMIQTQVYWCNLSTEDPGAAHWATFHCWNLHTVSSYGVVTSLATLCNLSLLAWPTFQGDQCLPSVHSSLQRRFSRLCTPSVPDLDYCTTCFSVILLVMLSCLRGI